MNPALKRLIGVTVSLTFFLGSIVIFTALIVPASNEIQDLRGEREALTSILEEENLRIEAVRKLFQQFGSLTTLHETLERALPTEEEIPNVINQLQGMANVSGVTIDSLDITFPAIKAANSNDVVRPLGEVQITFSLKGDYESVKSYLNGIETNVRIMDVQRLGIQGGVENNTLDYNIVVNAYYQL